nr:hypothetical protein [Tanacetum cinerariifolium]
MCDDIESTDSGDGHFDEECKSVNVVEKPLKDLDDILEPLEEEFEPLSSNNNAKSTHLETNSVGNHPLGFEKANFINNIDLPQEPIPGIIPNITEPQISPIKEGTFDCIVLPGFENVTKASQSFHVPKSNSLRSQLETQKTQFLNEIDRLYREYYYADHMNAILGVYTELDKVTNLQCDYLELLEKCKGLETELSKSKMKSKSFESVQKHAINLELELQK